MTRREPPKRIPFQVGIYDLSRTPVSRCPDAKGAKNNPWSFSMVRPRGLPVFPHFSGPQRNQSQKTETSIAPVHRCLWCCASGDKTNFGHHCLRRRTDLFSKHVHRLEGASGPWARSIQLASERAFASQRCVNSLPLGKTIFSSKQVSMSFFRGTPKMWLSFGFPF